MLLINYLKHLYLGTLVFLLIACYAPNQYNKSKKYHLPEEVKKTKTAPVDQANVLIDQNLASDHEKDTDKFAKKQEKQLKAINETPTEKEVKTKKNKSGKLDLY